MKKFSPLLLLSLSLTLTACTSISSPSDSAQNNPPKSTQTSPAGADVDALAKMADSDFRMLAEPIAIHLITNLVQGDVKASTQNVTDDLKERMLKSMSPVQYKEHFGAFVKAEYVTDYRTEPFRMALLKVTFKRVETVNGKTVNKFYEVPANVLMGMDQNECKIFAFTMTLM